MHFLGAVCASGTSLFSFFVSVVWLGELELSISKLMSKVQNSSKAVESTTDWDIDVSFANVGIDNSLFYNSTCTSQAQNSLYVAVTGPCAQQGGQPA